MPPPIVQTADTQFGTVTSNSTPWTITWPTNLQAGDLILLFTAIDGNAGVGGLPSGMVNIAGTVGGSAVTGVLFAKVADGTETGTFTIAPGSEQGAWRIFRITDWFGGTLVSANHNDGLSALASVTGSPSTTPNPPSLDPSNWATEDTLWIAMCAIDTSRTISVFPLASLQTSDVSGGSGGATLGLCMMNDSVGSKDPSTFTCSASDDWVAVTAAVRPAPYKIRFTPAVNNTLLRM